MADFSGITNNTISSLYSVPQDSVVSGQTDPSSKSEDTRVSGTQPSQNPLNATQTNVSKVVSSLNQQFASSSVRAEFASDEKSGEVWINMVDKSTGKVVFEIPSEGVRKLEENGVTKTGLTINYAG